MSFCSACADQEPYFAFALCFVVHESFMDKAFWLRGVFKFSFNERLNTASTTSITVRRLAKVL